MIGQSETGNSSQIIFITLFSGKCSAFVAVPLLQSLRQDRAKTSAEPNWHVLTSNFHLQALSLTYWAPVELLLLLKHFVMMSGSKREGGGGGRTPAPKTCIISREMHIIGSVVPNWGEENAGMVPVGSNRWCECIFWNGWGEQVRDNVASSSHHRAIEEKWN